MNIEEIEEKFNTVMVSDGREIKSIFYYKNEDRLTGYIMGVNNHINVCWDKHTGKSNLTCNTDLILKEVT